MATPDPLHPSRRMTAAAVVTAAVLWICALVLVHPAGEPFEVAERYLKALSEGDAGSAEAFIAEEARQDGALLTDEALTTGWTAESIEVVSEQEQGWVRDGQWTAWEVSYTIRYGDRTASGELELSDREGQVLVSDPYVEASVSTGFGFVELGGLLFEPAGGEAEVVMYPGAYRLFGSYPDIVDPSKAVVLAVQTDTWLNISRDAEDIFAVGEDLQTDVDQALREWIDGCAGRAEIAAPDCPFGAAPTLDEEMDVNTTRYENVSDLSWQVEFYPVVRLQATWHGLHAVTRVAGSIAVTAEATQLYSPDEGIVEVEAVCRIHADVEAELTEDGELDLHMSEGGGYTC